MLFTSSSDGPTVTPTTSPDNGTDPTDGPSLVTGSKHILFDLCTALLCHVLDLCPLPFCYVLMRISS